MPAWQPDWTDVVFDHGAAATAVDECRAVAAAARSARERLIGEGDAARTDWTGRWAELFGEGVHSTIDRVDQLAENLEATATAIEAAAFDAQMAQWSREEARRRWWAEYHAEIVARSDGPGL